MFDIDEYIRRFSRYPAPDEYKHWTREHEEISVHTRALTPKKLIEKRRPFEDEGIKDYRAENYEPITATIFSRAIDDLQRIMSGAQVSINVEGDLQAYLDEPMFDGLDFRAYINKKVIRRMIEDPNGVLVWWPTGPGVTASNTRVDVKPKLILSTQIKHSDEDVFTFHSRERSAVTIEEEGKEVTVYEGEVYYIVTKEGYYKYFQYGKKSDHRMELEAIYMHKLERLPLIPLGGEEAEELRRDGSSITYLKSYFYSAVPYANEAIRQFSDHQGIMVTAAFPIREIEEMPCREPRCKDGVITIIEGEGTEKKSIKKTCGLCQGRGSIIPLSPYGVLTKRKGTSLRDDKGTTDTPMMRYISPDVAIVKYSGEHWRQLLKDAEKALNLLFIDEAQSGKAKEIDREGKESMLDKIGANVFQSIILNSLKLIDQLRNLGSKANISVTLPASFKSKGEGELIEEIATLREKNAPSFLLAQATIDYVRKRYAGDRVMTKAIDFLSVYDPIFFLTQQEKDALLANAVINETQHGRSLFAFSAIQTVADEMGEDFLSSEFSAIASRVDNVINPMIQRQIPTNLGT